jgi:hypothetical protein
MDRFLRWQIKDALPGENKASEITDYKLVMMAITSPQSAKVLLE